MTVGRRLPDTDIAHLPVGAAGDDQVVGAYWRVLTRDGSRPLDVLNHPEDRAAWIGSNPTPEQSVVYDQNLTGGVWGVVDPVGRIGMLSIHTVREHEDGTISVRPGDGSSNSILIDGGGGITAPPWHGYIEHGVWTAC